MIGLISFYQVIIMSWVDFWPNSAYALETIEWRTDMWNL